jgi:hypothetical protein
MDLAVDAKFAHAARDQLGVLRTEVQNEDAVRVNVRARGRLGKDLIGTSWNARHGQDF